MGCWFDVADSLSTSRCRIDASAVKAFAPEFERFCHDSGMAAPSDPLDEWFAEHRSQRMARQMRQVESAKIVTTFVVGISAALLGTAIQIHGLRPRPMDLVAAVLFIGSVLASFMVFIRDKTPEVDPVAVIRAVRMKDPDQALEDLRLAEDTALERNDDVWSSVRTAMS